MKVETKTTYKEGEIRLIVEEQVGKGKTYTVFIGSALHLCDVTEEEIKTIINLYKTI